MDRVDAGVRTEERSKSTTKECDDEGEIEGDGEWETEGEREGDEEPWTERRRGGVVIVTDHDEGLSGEDMAWWSEETTAAHLEMEDKPRASLGR